MRRKKQIATDDLEMVQSLALVRAVAGLFLFVAPRRAGRAWTGEDSGEVTSNLAARGMGARDVAIGMGTLIAIERGAPVRGWLEAGVLSDSADAAGTLMQWRSLGTPRALFWFATEVGAAVLGSRLAQSLD